MAAHTPARDPSSRLSEEFLRLKSLCSSEKISFEELFESLEDRGHALLTLIISSPFLLPVPLPGLSVIFGVLLMFAGIGLALNRKPWFPKKLRERQIPAKIFERVFHSAFKISKKLERFIRPRGVKFFKWPAVRLANGLMICVCGFFLALPLPPGTNFPPGSAIVLLSLGLLEEDIWVSVIGTTVFFLNLVFFGEVFMLAVTAVQRYFDL